MATSRPPWQATPTAINQQFSKPLKITKQPARVSHRQAISKQPAIQQAAEIDKSLPARQANKALTNLARVIPQGPDINCTISMQNVSEKTL